MKRFRISKGLQIRYKKDVWELIRIIEGRYQFESTMTGEYMVFQRVEFEEAYNTGEIEIVAGRPGSQMDGGGSVIEKDTHISPKLTDAVQRKLKYVQKAKKLNVGRGQIRRLAEIIPLVAAEINDHKVPSPQTVYNWYKQYLENDCDFMSLVDRFDQRGRGAMLDPIVNSLIEHAIDEIYLTREQNSMSDVYFRVVALIDAHNERPGCENRLSYPSRKTVERRIGKRPSYDLTVAREGIHRAKHDFRAVRNLGFTTYPLERAETDHTTLNLFVVDDKLNMPLGRPVITGIRDTHTAMPLGIFISFASPSTYSILGCIKSVLTMKGSIRSRFPEIENEWPAYGLPEVLVSDNGPEFHGFAYKKVVSLLGISQEWNKVLEPWLKGGIERFMGTINPCLLESQPGTTFKNIFAKKDYDPKKHAVIRFSTLVMLVHKWLLDVYMVSPIRTRDARPIDLWNEGIKIAPPYLPAHVDELSVIIGRYKKGRLSHEGIFHWCLQYNSDELTDIRKRHGKSLKVDFKYDDTDLSHIYVVDPDSKEFIKVPCLDFEYAHGLNKWQHDLFRRHVRDEMKCKVDISALARAKEFIRQTVADELGRKQVTAPLLKAQLAGLNSEAVIAGKSNSIVDLALPQKPHSPKAPTALEIDPVLDIPDFGVEFIKKGRQ